MAAPQLASGRAPAAAAPAQAHSRAWWGQLRAAAGAAAGAVGGGAGVLAEAAAQRYAFDSYSTVAQQGVAPA